jgi:acetyl esterase/lipase
MKTRVPIITLLLASLLLLNANAQITTLNLWPDGIPGLKLNDSYVEKATINEGKPTRFEKVTDPSLYIFLPPKETATGTAVLICPGGGYTALAFSHEGFAIAKWLNEHGIAGVVLKYRLPSDMIMQDKSVGPLRMHRKRSGSYAVMHRRGTLTLEKSG